MIRSTVRVRFALPLALLLALLLALGTTACGEDPTGGETAVPGDMTATLVSPTGATASALLEVTSGTVVSVVSGDPDLLVQRVTSAPVRIVAIRGTPGTIRFLLHTEDVTRPPELRVVDVGDADDALLATTSGYSVSLVREGGS